MDMKREAMTAGREVLGDYQLYRLPWATDLNARQTKQAVFLVKPRVKVRRFYSYFLDAQSFEPEAEESLTPTLILAFENRKTSGLGEPLPEGMMRIFDTTGTGDVFAGEAHMIDKSVNIPVELEVAEALDLGLEIHVERPTPAELREAKRTTLADVELRALNAKGVPVTLEIRQQADEYMRGAAIPKSSQRTFRKYGDFAWLLRVPANGSKVLTYRLEIPAAPADDGK